MKNKNILLYTAGYLDGDGCFYLGKTIQKPKMITVYESSVQCVSVKREVLELFKEQFGGYISEKPPKKNHKPAFCWTIKQSASACMANAIQPFLVDKAVAAKIYCEFCRLIGFNDFEKVPSNIIEKRNNLINEIRKDRHMNNFVTKESIEEVNKNKCIKTPQDADYVYLAGLIDSEGCFRIKKWQPKNKPNEVYAIVLEIGNTKLPILPWLTERFGGHVQYISPRKNKRASATWSIAAKTLFAILPKIRPFLIGKQPVCDKLIEFQDTILPNGGDRHSELFKALFERRREVRERIIGEIHELNHKGS